MGYHFVSMETKPSFFRGVKKSLPCFSGSEALVGRWCARVSDRLLQRQASADRHGCLGLAMVSHRDGIKNPATDLGKL